MYNFLLKIPEYNPPEPLKIGIVEAWIKKNQFKRVLDIGAGKGHYAKRIKKIAKVDALEPYSDKFIKKTILEFEPAIMYDAVFCMDVLEHIHPLEISKNLKKIKTFSDHALFGIANHSDMWDMMELHLIQQDSEWWSTILQELYREVTLIKQGERYFIFECIR